MGGSPPPAARRGYADTAVGQVHYRECGGGGGGGGGGRGSDSAVVLAHMAEASSTQYARVLPLLGRDRRAIALDSPGCGASAPLERWEDVIEQYATAVLGLLDHLELERASLVGFHTGASVMLEVATRCPQRVERLVLAGVLAVDPADAAARADWVSRVVLPWEPDGRGEFVDWCARWIRLYVPAADGEGYLRELISFLQSRPANWWAHNGAIHYDVEARLRELTRPVLFLNPREDNLYESTRRVHALVAGSAYSEIDGADGAPITHPEQFAAAVLAFLSATS